MYKCMGNPKRKHPQGPRVAGREWKELVVLGRRELVAGGSLGTK